MESEDVEVKPALKIGDLVYVPIANTRGRVIGFENDANEEQMVQVTPVDFTNAVTRHELLIVREDEIQR